MSVGASEVILRFQHSWVAEILASRPLILPSRAYIYPQAAEEIERGALEVLIKPAGDNIQPFLATCALGFRDPSLPTGIFACPRADDLLALAGGYAYLIDTLVPEHCLHLPLRPTTQVLPAQAAELILLAGFHNILALDANGIRWQSARLSWEGVTMTSVDATHLHGTGWNMHTDREAPFTIDLATGAHEGGGFQL